MAYVFHGLGGKFSLSPETWGTPLARAGAWNPRGTQRPEPLLSGWDGSYNSQAGQRVTDDDAYAPDEAIQGIIPEVSDMPEPPDRFEEGKLEAFTTFCRMGGFRIECDGTPPG